MIRQTALLWNLVLALLVTFVASKDTRQTHFPDENGDASGSNAASPVLLMLSEMMNKEAKSASLKELQKQMESDRSHIQKIPRRNQEKMDLEQKKKELEEKERELEGNFVLSPDFDKYSYKNAKQEPSIKYSVDSVCQLATCYKDGKPFLNIHNYCYNGIHDLQAACEERFLSARYRRAGGGNVLPVIQSSREVEDTPCVPGEEAFQGCNLCYCLSDSRKFACRRMKCPPKDVENAAPMKSRRDISPLFKPFLTNEHPNSRDLENPDSSN